jgi:putative ABC transport system substrate-binding protein
MFRSAILPAQAAESVRLNIDVIVAPAAQNVAAAQQATRTIPIVMVSVGDPVAMGSSPASRIPVGMSPARPF